MKPSVFMFLIVIQAAQIMTTNQLITPMGNLDLQLDLHRYKYFFSDKACNFGWNFSTRCDSLYEHGLVWRR